MAFTSGIPAPGQSLGQTRDPIKDNFTNYNTVVSQDHIPPNAAGQGKHNQVTTPVYVANPVTGLPPVTIANEPKFYGFQDSANIGVIQYSRGPSNAIPTPVTNLFSQATGINLAPSPGPGNKTTVLDFTGLTRAFATLYIADMNVNVTTEYLIVWTGAAFRNTLIRATATDLVASTTGNILSVLNVSTTTTYTDVFWVLALHRLQ